MKSFEEIMKIKMDIYGKNREKLMEYPGFSEERYLKNIEKEVGDILNIFNDKNIDFEIEMKDGWGLIYVFEISSYIDSILSNWVLYEEEMIHWFSVPIFSNTHS